MAAGPTTGERAAILCSSLAPSRSRSDEGFSRGEEQRTPGGECGEEKEGALGSTSISSSSSLTAMGDRSLSSLLLSLELTDASSLEPVSAEAGAPGGLQLE